MMWLLCGNPHSELHRSPAVPLIYNGQGECSKQRILFKLFSIPSLLASQTQKQQKLEERNKAFPCIFLMISKLPSEEDEPFCPGCAYLLPLCYIQIIFSHFNSTFPLTAMLGKLSFLFLGFLCQSSKNYNKGKGKDAVPQDDVIIQKLPY